MRAASYGGCGWTGGTSSRPTHRIFFSPPKHYWFGLPRVMTPSLPWNGYATDCVNTDDGRFYHVLE
jgi:hypothetical protein